MIAFSQVGIFPGGSGKHIYFLIYGWINPGGECETFFQDHKISVDAFKNIS